MIIVCLGLAGLVWFDNQGNDDDIAIDRKVPASKVKRIVTIPTKVQGVSLLANPLAKMRLSEFKETTSRPLFSKNRKAPTVKKIRIVRPKKRATRNVGRLNYTLMGVLADGDRSIALIRHNSSGRSLRVEQGDVIDGWVVNKIDIESLVFARKDGPELRVTIYKE